MSDVRPFSEAEAARLDNFAASRSYLSLWPGWEQAVYDHGGVIDGAVRPTFCSDLHEIAVSSKNADSGKPWESDSQVAEALYRALPPDKLQQWAYSEHFWNALSLLDHDAKTYLEWRWPPKNDLQAAPRYLLVGKDKNRLTRHGLFRLWIAAHLVTRARKIGKGQFALSDGLQRFFSNQSTSIYLSETTDMRDPVLLAVFLEAMPNLVIQGELLYKHMMPRLAALGSIRELSALNASAIADIIRRVDGEITEQQQAK